MEFANHLILLGAFLLLLSIFVGLVSSRIGAPLLLAFLGLGIFFGEDGPGGIFFENYFAAYTIGTMALAIILFDGGLRTEFRNFRAAAWPAMLLATVGVALTALLTGAAAKLVLGFGWVESILIGSIVSSTDAAAVFFLLHLHGLEIKPRVRGLLEIEAAHQRPGGHLPDRHLRRAACWPAIAEWSWFLLLDFINEIIGGAAARGHRGLRAGLADQPAGPRRRALPGPRHGVRALHVRRRPGAWARAGSWPSTSSGWWSATGATGRGS